jgi:hypothetical protein
VITGGSPSLDTCHQAELPAVVVTGKRFEVHEQDLTNSADFAHTAYRQYFLLFCNPNIQNNIWATPATFYCKNSCSHYYK